MKENFLNQVIYPLLSFPFSIIYFICMIVGLSLGLGFIITLVGIPLLIGTAAAATLLCKYERIFTNSLLGTGILPLSKVETPSGIWLAFKTRFSDERTWSRIVYLILKFPLNIIGFAVTVTLIFSTVLLLITPVVYRYAWFQTLDLGAYQITSLPNAFVASLLGILIGIFSFYIIKGLAVFFGKIAQVALSDHSL